MNRGMSLFHAVLCLSVGYGLAGNVASGSWTNTQLHNNMPIICHCTIDRAILCLPTTGTDLLLNLRLDLTDFPCYLRRPLPRDVVCRSGAMPKIHESTWPLRCRPSCCLRDLCRNAWLQIRAHNNQCWVEHEIHQCGNARQRSAEQ